MSKKKKKLHKLILKANRDKAKEQGFFDGRFNPKVIPDKKKKAKVWACRNFKKRRDVEDI